MGAVRDGRVYVAVSVAPRVMRGSPMRRVENDVSESETERREKREAAA